MSQTDLFLRFGAAIALGFLIGLQREFAKGGVKRKIFAGERTFALSSMLGCLAAMAADELDSGLVFIGIVLVLGTFAIIAYLIGTREGYLGTTTEVAFILSVLIGALCYWGYLTLAGALGIATIAILSIKLETDRFVRALTREDFVVALQFAIITAIVLPLLPNQSYFLPPFDVLNPFNIWLMVVFISGISFLGYVAMKIVGPRQGLSVIGFLGGLVSSTAVTLSFSRRSLEEQELHRPLALAITIAWTMMFPRMLIEVGVVNRTLLNTVWLPLTAAGVAGLGYCIYLFFSRTGAGEGELEIKNPFDLSSAIKFGLIYGLILLVSRTAQMYLGNTGVFISSIVSGMADVDAIALTMAELNNSGGLAAETASRAIVLAAMSNTVVKGGIALVLGSVALRKVLLPVLLMILVAGIGIAFIL
jgi:uncharacterized membrane protein (DUF4010 family)